jgi:DNA replication initiation complex subunit (GINS family)
MITIRILKDLPQIVGVDGKVYGAFKEEDVVTLPEPNGLVFINQGVAEQVNIA